MPAAWPMVDTPTGVVYTVACGGRYWQDFKTVAHWLEALREQFPLLTLIDGAAPGADQCAGTWADRKRQNGVHHIPVRARWSEYPQHMRWKAGHDRNTIMRDMLVAARERDGHGVAVVAFKAELDPALFSTKACKGGTENMIRQAWEKQIPVWHTADEHAPRLLRAPEDPPSLF